LPDAVGLSILDRRRYRHTMPRRHQGPAAALARPRALLPLIAVLPWGLAGCLVGPDFKPPAVTVPRSWSAASDPRIATQTTTDGVWWKSFKDPALDRLVDLAYRQNLPLQIAGLRIVEARAQLGIATGSQFPQVQVAFATATAVGLSQDAANVQGFSRHYGNFELGFDAAWEIDFWGRYRRGVQAEEANLIASVADYYSAIVSVTAEVARTYVTMRQLEVLIEQARQNAKIQEDGLSIAESRFSNGATSELDPSQARALLESTRATIPQLAIALVQARNALATLLGQPVGTIDALLAGPKAIPSVAAKVAVGLPAELLRRRPDVRSAELFAAAQCARIGVARADLFPSFTLFGTVGFQASNKGGGAHDIFSGNNLFYVVGPRIAWPFFNYGRLENQVRVEDARFQELLTSYRDTVLRAAEEVEDALAGFLNAQDAALLQQAAVKAAERSVELSLVQYKEGATDYQRVLDSQRFLLQQQNGLTQTSSSVATNLIALYKALGGGWELREGQPIVPETTQNEMKERTRWGDMLSPPAGPDANKSPPPAAQH